MLSFEVELMAFQVAIFLAMFPSASYLNVELTPKEIVKYIQDHPGFLKGDSNFYIHPDVLHHGFHLFKKPLTKFYGIVMESKRGRNHYIPTVCGLNEKATGYLVKILSVDVVGAAMVDKKLCLSTHRQTLLRSITDLRDMLLKAKELPHSVYNTQDSVLYVSPTGDFQDKRRSCFVDCSK